MVMDLILVLLRNQLHLLELEVKAALVHQLILLLLLVGSAIRLVALEILEQEGLEIRQAALATLAGG